MASNDSRILVTAFTAALLMNAVLLFSVQPLVGKLLLPLLGGTPAVWNTCQLFFQATLLLGYGYAHLSTRWLPAPVQRGIHGVLLLVPLAVLPMALAPGAMPPTESSPIPWLLLQLAMVAGLPFLVISTGAPLLQHWFSRSGHPEAHDPYFLYAASNVGSLVGLLAYPLFVEPRWNLAGQAELWSWGYRLVVLLVLLCLFLVGSGRGQSAVPEDASGPGPASALAAEAAPAPTWTDVGAWLAASLVPSSLMLGVTTYITTDVAAIPLIWVVPLALYLLTFVLAYARKPPYRPEWVSRLLPYFLLPVAISSRQMTSWMWVPVHLGVFFLGALACHDALARRRPAARYLTGYFFWVSLGGVLGGACNGLVAPLVFDTVLEYPLMLVACCFFRAPLDLDESPEARRQDWLRPLGLGLWVMASHLALSATGTRGLTAMVVLFGLPALLCFSFLARPLRFALGYAVLTLAGSSYMDLSLGRLLHVERNFFGVKRVLRAFDSPTHILVHGNTRHGTQSQTPEHRDTPLAYYHPTGPAGQVLELLQARGGAQRVGLVGLGAGALLTYARPGDRYILFEIDPGVVAIAENPEFFQFLPDRRDRYRMVLGDGRLTLGHEPDASFDVLVLDAFSSDSVPSHLLTREALALYLRKLRPGGVLLFHISNRFFRFPGLLARLASEVPLEIRVCKDAVRVGSELERLGKTSSVWAVLARDGSWFAKLPGAERWETPEAPADLPAWSDDFSNILVLLR